MKKTRKVTAILLIFAMLFSLSAISGIAKAEPEVSVEDLVDIDATHQLKQQEQDDAFMAQQDAYIQAMAAELFDGEETPEGESEVGYFTENHGSKYFLALDAYVGQYYFKEFTLRSIGDNIEIWVANDLDYLDDRPSVIITQDQVNYMRDLFDDVIYPTDTEFFGTPDSRSGENSLLSAWGDVPANYYVSEDGNDKIVMLVDNVRDDAFYDPSSFLFTAGFFSSGLEAYADRNIITIDSLRWDVAIDLIFKGTVAHEFQHLIHNDNDPFEELYIDEGMADFAEFLCFGEHSWGHVNAFLEKPENSLITWDEYGNEPIPETLSDYGQAYLLQLYLYDHYGKDFVKMLATDGTFQGAEAVNYTLNEFGTGIDFAELFRRFSVAVAVDNPNAVAMDLDGDTEKGIYAFDSIDVEVDFETALAFDKDGVPAWGADYKVIENASDIKTVLFDGVDVTEHQTPWTLTEDLLDPTNLVMWGGEGSELDNAFKFDLDLTGIDTATLVFEHLYQIETAWDYGFVEVSLDGGATWNVLTNENTVAYDNLDGYPSILDKLSNGAGFTGTNGGWTTETMDLSAYAGNEVTVKFSFMTDWGTEYLGWYINSISVPEIGYTNTCEDLSDFVEYRTVEYGVTFVNVTTKGKSKELVRMMNIDAFSVEDVDSVQLNNLFNSGTTYMITWYAADEVQTGTIDFTYELVEKFDNTKEKDNPGKGNKKK